MIKQNLEMKAIKFLHLNRNRIDFYAFLSKVEKSLSQTALLKKRINYHLKKKSAH